MAKFTTILNLSEGEDDREKTLESVRKSITFRGANLWILACAILLACVGLNVNSVAVLIGAMLISPLMGPVVGAGFALGIYDFTLLKKSLYNLAVATLVSVSVSTLYFYITPFKDVQSELLARTAPNIFDIFIAFFGGLVGAIAVTRIEKGNPVPGVAIATALMPPLCTVGYGIANGQWTFVAGAFYLFSLNCVFIGIATFVIIKYLKYPAKKQVNETQQKQVKIIITLLIAVMLVPSAYLAWSLYREQQFKKSADLFIEKEFTSKGYTVVYKKSDFTPKNKKLELAFLQKRFNAKELDTLRTKLNAYNYMAGTALVIRQDTTDRFIALKGDILNEIRSSENEVNLKDAKIVQLEKKLSENTFDNQKLLKETRALFPGVTAMSVSNNSFATIKDSTYTTTAVIIDATDNLSRNDKAKLTAWLTQRLSVKNVQLYQRQ